MSLLTTAQGRPRHRFFRLAASVSLFFFAAVVPAWGVAVKYKVVVKTGTEANAGTDANIWITLRGVTGGAIVDHKLAKAKRNDFEKGHEDDFEIQGNDNYGPIREISIRRDSSGDNNNWYLDWVKVYYYYPGSEPHPLYPREGNANVTTFVFKGWVPAGKDKAVSPTLQDAEKIDAMDVEMTAVSEMKLMFPVRNDFISNFAKDATTGGISYTATIDNRVMMSETEGKQSELLTIIGVSTSSGVQGKKDDSLLGSAGGGNCFAYGVRKKTETTKEVQGAETREVKVEKTFPIDPESVTVVESKIWQIYQLGHLTYNDYATSKMHTWAFASPAMLHVELAATAFKISKVVSENGVPVYYVKPADKNAYVSQGMAQKLKENGCRLENVPQSALKSLPKPGATQSTEATMRKKLASKAKAVR